MRPLSLLAMTLMLLAAGPGTSAALAQDDATKTEPQVVEPKVGEAVPPVTTPGTPADPAGPDAPVSSDAGPGAVTGPSGPTGQAGVTGAEGQQAVAGKGNDNDEWLLIGAIVLGVLLLAFLITRGLWHWRGWDPRWRKRSRHANAEASWRMSLGWAEFRDFLRLGR